MGRVKIPYYAVRRNGRGFWEPTAKMRELGFGSVACGADGPQAWEIARRWNDRWQRVRRGEDISPEAARRPGVPRDAVMALRIYPPGSIGEAFQRMRRVPELWETKAVRTREEWDRVWTYLDPLVGDVAPGTLTIEDLASIRTAIATKVSPREAHRVIKVWRALWKVAAAMGYCRRDGDPSLGIRNSAPAPRQSTWREGEVVRLAKGAWRAGYLGLSAVIAVGWDSQLSPVDLRGLTSAQGIRSAKGVAFLVARAKTGRAAAGTLGPRATRLIEAYIASLGAELLAHAPIFRNRSGRAYSKDTLGDDFRTVRAMVFGAAEARTLADFRRSGAVEAMAGNATSEALSAKMANTLSASNALHKTYVPVDLDAVYSVDDARKRGRHKSTTHRDAKPAFPSRS